MSNHSKIYLKIFDTPGLTAGLAPLLHLANIIELHELILLSQCNPLAHLATSYLL